MRRALACLFVDCLVAIGRFVFAPVRASKRRRLHDIIRGS